MDNYNKVKLDLEKNNCTLITSFEEFETKRESVLNKYYGFVRIDFIGICGHNSSAVVTNFVVRQTGIRCKDCVKNSTSKTLKVKARISTEVETNSIKIIEEYLSGYYDVQRTKEGCRADLAIREIENVEDNWIPIQVKCTEQICHNMYSFRTLKKEYRDMLLICVCNSEKKIWIVPYNDLNSNLSSLNISRVSKYNEYGCADNTKLNAHIDKHKNKCIRQSLDTLLLPVSDLQQREQEYIKKREKYVDFLDYKYPDVQNTSTDFIVNNKKVQEKVAGLSLDKGKNVVLATLGSNNGKYENGSRKYRTYRLGENDYYWIHSSIDDRFWIIPEVVLYDKGYITKADETQNKKVIYISYNTEWIKKYEYTYSSVNKDKIKSLFD